MLGEILKEARRRKGLTQQDLAKALKKSRALISHWEKGRLKPTEKDVLELSRILEIPLSKLHEALYPLKEKGVEPLFLEIQRALLDFPGGRELLKAIGAPQTVEPPPPALPTLGLELKLKKPLNSAVLSQEDLTFEWDELDVSSYRLFVYDLDTSGPVADWEVEGPPSRYQGTKELEEGKRYGWYVIALREGKPWTKSETGVFRLLTAEERKKLEEILGMVELLRGVTYGAFELYDDAKACLEKINDPRAYAALSEILKAQGLAKEARKFFEKLKGG